MASIQGMPTGTVTLLFADVEGSTRLLNLLGERFGPARARMRELVRAAARAHDGSEVDWAGDGVFLVFSRARDAVAAAARIHRSLAAEPWPDDEAHRLRIGLHTGEPDLGAEGYVGIDVVIASRICAASHGEQIVVSQATRDVSGATPLTGASYRPLGRHRLKDVPGTIQLYQFLAPGLREDFPPLKTLTATSLPALHHRLVGREDALARVEHLLDTDGARLVTITGHGGAGKSRLALEVAAAAAVQRPVHLVGLAPVTDPDLVPSAIARAIGVREPEAQPLLDAVGDRLEGSRALLYLDNLEHLPAAATHVAGLLDRAPDLQVLATSRAPLRLSIERVMPLEPLALEDAATLFVELAAARGVVLHDDALASVREICRRLDGLPLAIELVAARLAVLPPAEIVRALGEGLALRMEGPIDLPERQRTLQSAIDWSYHRLTDSQRALHSVVAVFSDSASLDDARALDGTRESFLPDLEALVGWSLIRTEAGDGNLRLSMLETVREFAIDRLRAADTLDDVRTRHAEHFLELALAAESELSGKDQIDWLNRLEREYDNLTATFDWLLSSGRAEDALRAVSALERFWRAHAHVSEARRWLALGLELATDVPPDTRADALWAAARQATGQSDWDAADPLLEEALSLFRERKRHREEVFALSELGYIALRRDDTERAATLCNEALSIARRLGDARATSAVLLTLSDVARMRGEHDRALAFAEEALELRRVLGDPLTIIDSTYHVGVAAFAAGDLDRAATAFEATLEHARALGDALGGYAATAGHPEDAARLWGAADAARRSRSLEYAEPMIEERFTPLLVESLGVERVEELRAEGRRLGFEQTLENLRDVVASTGAE